MGSSNNVLHQLYIDAKYINLRVGKTFKKTNRLKKMSDQQLLTAQPMSKPMSSGKMIGIIIIAIVVFLGSIVLLVFGSTQPNDTTAHTQENQAMIGVGVILLIASVVLPIVYFTTSTPMSAVSQGAYLPPQAAAFSNRGF